MEQFNLAELTVWGPGAFVPVGQKLTRLQHLLQVAGLIAHLPVGPHNPVELTVWGLGAHVPIVARIIRSQQLLLAAELLAHLPMAQPKPAGTVVPATLTVFARAGHACAAMSLAAAAAAPPVKPASAVPVLQPNAINAQVIIVTPLLFIQAPKYVQDLHPLLWYILQLL
jgi:hypothetical protein